MLDECIDKDRLTIDEVPGIPPDVNPFDYDKYNMGQWFGKDWRIMYDHAPDGVFKYVIFVHIPSGRRFLLEVPPSLVVDE